MTTEVKLFIAIIGGTLLMIIGASLMLGRNGTTGPGGVDTSVLVRADSHFFGNENAKVTIVEFSDFECPACKTIQPVIKEVLNQYKDQVKFVYRNFPIPSHQYSILAATAAEAAGKQGKFWEYHDKLFEKSPDLSKDNLIFLATGLNLDVAKFAADLDSPDVAQKVANDKSDGDTLNISVTPTFFINGTKFNGGLTLDEFKKQIDSRLK